MARAPAALRLVADRAGRALAGAGVPERGDGVVLAVSGGADSLALLHALRTLAGPRGWRLEVVTVDHGLRPGSAADAVFVVDHAKSLGLGAHLATLASADLEAYRAAGPEGAARAARYRVLRQIAERTGCRFAATGHTLDDQAETVLLQLLRGAGPDGMGAIAVRDGWLLRPLLGVRRSQTRACCRALDLAWREDSSNDDERLLRNAVRHRLLPLLEELRPGAAATLARTAGLSRQEREWLDPVVAAAMAALLREPGPAGGPAGGPGGGPAAGGAPGVGPAGPEGGPAGGVALAAGALAGLPPGLGRRVVRAACRRAGCGTPAAATTDRILALAGQARPGRAVRWPGGAAWRDRDALLLAQPDDRPAAADDRPGAAPGHTGLDALG